ncbi:MAG: hypothetical protein WC337_01480 [Candidatus Muiribacteriota bacterium]
MKIIYVFKSGLNFGSGHVSRAKFLSEYIKNNIMDCEFTFIGEDKDDVYKKILPQSIIVSSDEEILNYIKKIKADFVFLDRRINSKFILEEAGKISKTIVIEDPEILPHQAYVIWDSNRSENSKKAENEILGFDNVLINPEILQFSKKKIRKKAHKIFICMGGTDVNRVIPDIVCKLSSKFKITVLPGVHYNDYLKLKSVNVKILNSNNFCWKEIAECDFGLVSGGIVMSEALSLFMPLIVWPQVNHQIVNANELKEKNLITVFEKKENIVNIAQEFADDYKTRHELNEKLKKVQYGRGINKVLKYLEVCNE